MIWKSNNPLQVKVEEKQNHLLLSGKACESTYWIVDSRQCKAYYSKASLLITNSVIMGHPFQPKLKVSKATSQLVKCDKAIKPAGSINMTNTKQRGTNFKAWPFDRIRAWLKLNHGCQPWTWETWTVSLECKKPDNTVQVMNKVIG